MLHVGQPKEAVQRAAAWNRKYAPTKLEQADFYINKRQNLVFHGASLPKPLRAAPRPSAGPVQPHAQPACRLHAGTLHARTSYATMGMELDMRAGGLEGTVGLVVRVKGDGQTYGVILTTGAPPWHRLRHATLRRPGPCC